MDHSKRRARRKRIRSPLLILLLIMLLLAGLQAGAAYAGNIDPDGDGSRYAYGENVGWINFKPAFGDGVTVTDTAVTGFAYGENVGWINLSPANGGVVNDGRGHLSGYAWGENVGWIDFASTGGRVTIDGATGKFSGFAWGENAGWINFAPTGGGVTTSWRAHMLLTVAKAGTGSVTSDPAGVSCGSTCSAEFPFGTNVSLTETHPTGFTITWSGDCTGPGPCTVIMDKPRIVTADFQDSSPPAITHTPVMSWKEKTDLPISATISDNVAVQGAKLFYRTSGANSFSFVTMTLVGGKYTGTILGTSVSKPSIEYYLETQDAANNITRSPIAAPATSYSMVVGSTPFLDDPLIAGTTLIKAVHFTELLATINNTLAPKYSVGPFGWSGPAPAPGLPVSAAHLTDLRTAVKSVHQAKYGTDPTYAEAVTAGVVIKASHFNELRMYVRKLE